jgi:uncharacterized membrane protein YeiH
MISGERNRAGGARQSSPLSSRTRGFFAVAGAEKALVHGLAPIMAALLGMLTGVGGGILRGVLVAQIPVVLRADL